MADYYTFGVVPSDIGRYLPRIAFSTDSQPTFADAVEIIKDHAADLCAFLYGMSVDLDALSQATNSAMYRNCQQYILLRLAAQIMRGRNQNDQTAADTWDNRADALRDRLRSIPQDLGSTRPTATTAGNIMHSNADYPEQIYRNSILSRSRLAINATQDRM